MAKPAVAVPTPEQVTVYLTAHKLETAIEEAVNDAVLKQVRVCDAMPQTPVGARALPQMRHLTPPLSAVARRIHTSTLLRFS